MNRFNMTNLITAVAVSAACAMAPTVARANTLNYNGLPHTSTGVATLAPAGPNLVVSNIGSSGLDGVSVDIDPSSLYAMDWLPVDGLNATPLNVDLLKIATTGRMGGPVQPLGDSTLMRIGAAQYEIIADYSAAGSATFKIELYLGGGIVFAQTGVTLPLAVGGDGTKLPVGAAAGLPGSIAGSDPGFIWSLPSGLPVTIPAGPTILSDEIRLLTDNPTAPFTSLADFSLLARDIPLNQVTITGSSSRVIPEPATISLLAIGAIAGLRRRRKVS